MARRKKTDNVPAIIEKNEPMRYSESVTLFPVTKERTPPNDNFAQSLPRGKYDIHYVILLLKIIIGKCESFHTKDFKLSMTHSLKKMLAYLEVERDQP